MINFVIVLAFSCVCESFLSNLCKESAIYAKLRLKMRSPKADDVHVGVSPSSERYYLKRRLIEYLRHSSLISSTLMSTTLYSRTANGAPSRKPLLYSGAIGYEAAPSAFSPGQTLLSVPLLPQSALLNSLPLKDELIGQLQAYFESFVQLINPSSLQQSQLSNNESVLWSNLQVNAQRAAGIFIYNKQDLLPDFNDSDDIPYDMKLRAAEFADRVLTRLQYDALELVNSSRQSQIPNCLRGMRKCLNGLCDIAYLLSNPLSIPREPLYLAFDSKIGRQSFLPSQINSTFDQLSIYNFDLLKKSWQRLPRLRGRATVVLNFQRPGPSQILNSKKVDFFGKLENMNEYQERAEVRLVVDGINHPYTAGNFIDLCRREFYDNIVIKSDTFDEFKGSLKFNDNGRNKRTIMGYYKDGFVDPVNNIARRIPLEVLRENTTNIRSTAVGAARNSLVFTSSAPVQSFATVREHISYSNVDHVFVVWSYWDDA